MLSMLECLRWGRFLIVRRVFGRSDSADERDEADGGGSGRLDEPAAGGGERNHQGLENKIIELEFGSVEEGKVNCRKRLGGLLRYYHRDAA